MRPQYGKSLGFERILNVYFYTSNPDKLLQARLMFVRHGYLPRIRTIPMAHTYNVQRLVNSGRGD
jgi:hypothetical protein